MWHALECVSSPPDVCSSTLSWLFRRTSALSLPFRVRPVPDSLLPRWLMLNDRQTLIKAAPGSPPVTVAKASNRGDDKWEDKSSMPRFGPGPDIKDHTAWLDFISFIALNNNTLQWTSAAARLSHRSMQACGLVPLHSGVLEPRGQEMPG